MICEHILADEPEDQIAIRGDTTFVPRLRPSTNLTQAFPTKLTPDATYVVTAEPVPLAASSPPTSPSAGRVISPCCAEARSRRETNGRSWRTIIGSTRPSTRSARSRSSALK